MFFFLEASQPSYYCNHGNSGREIWRKCLFFFLLNQNHTIFSKCFFVPEPNQFITVFIVTIATLGTITGLLWQPWRPSCGGSGRDACGRPSDGSGGLAVFCCVTPPHTGAARCFVIHTDVVHRVYFVAIRLDIILVPVYTKKWKYGRYVDTAVRWSVSIFFIVPVQPCSSTPRANALLFHCHW